MSLKHVHYWRNLALLLAVACAGVAHAHKSSDSYLHLAADTTTTVKAQWDIALRDLDMAIGIDTNVDGALTWGEVKSHHREIAAYALSRLQLRAGGPGCTPGTTELLLDEHSDGAYAVLRFQYACAAVPRDLALDYRLFADLDADHRGLLNLTLAGQQYTALLGPETARAAFGQAEPAAAQQFMSYATTGLAHIWAGFDHLLFLFSLLLPAVLQRQGRQWIAHASLWPAFVATCKTVTAFTAAHSVTLSLASLGFVSVPSQLSESAIALSVVAAALNNVFPIVQARLWVVAFAFGLIHGLGFANMLLDLHLNQGTMAVALLGFNLGVEAGQLLIVAAFLPVAFGLRRTAFYQRGVLTAGSLLVAAIGSLWLLERAMDWQLLPFH